MTILQILGCLACLVIIPFMAGGLINFILPERDSLCLRFLSGYIIEFAVFDLLVLPSIFLKISLHIFTLVFMVVMIALSVYGLVSGRRTIHRTLKNALLIPLKLRANWLLILSIVIILSQTVYVVRSTHIDDDDAFYVATAETAVATDTLMEIDPYTGEYYEALPARYMLSPVMVWNAVMSKCTGVSPVIMAHTVLPAVLIPLCYMVYYLFAELLRRKKKIQNTGLFMFLISLIFSFSGYSVYSQGTFLMTRIWQGKAILAAILLPAVLYYLLTFFENGMRRPYYIWMFFVMTACCLVSEMGIMLGMIAYGTAILVYITEKKRLVPMLSCLLGCFLSCAVNVICAIAYIIFK